LKTAATKPSPLVERAFRTANLRKDAGLHGVYVAGADRIVPRTFGSNTGIRPFRCGRTKALDDTISDALDSANALYEARVWFRFWVVGKEAGDLLYGCVENYSRSSATPLRRTWYGLAEDVSIDDLRTALEMQFAEHLPELHVRDDHQLRVWLLGEAMNEMRRAGRF
jgi:hypothetical protein